MPEHKALIDAATSAANLYLFSADDWREADRDAGLPAALVALAKANDFKASSGQTVVSADADGKIVDVLGGLGAATDGLAVAALSSKLPIADYQVARGGDYPMAQIAAGWADGAYRFDRYLSDKADPPRLVVGDGPDGEALVREAIAIDRLRDLVNTPAEDMGPPEIQGTISDLAERHGATVQTIIGDALLEQNYPMVHAVGRAGPEAPRIMELIWGDESHPQLALVGKGVAFDTGGLNLKTGNYMRLMKKDMGGAAHAIALAELVMGANLPVHLKLYIPAVENAIAGDAFRPGDVLSSRKGLSVEIDNTDAEGRLILGDALTRASEEDPDLLIDFATLTGAARVALGPELAPYYTDDETLAAEIASGAAASGDPAWRMPLWAPYKSMLKSPIADLVNSASGGMAGSITAAIFLKQFVDAKSWVHLDVWAWREGKYGRPAGGAACGLRAMWETVRARYS
ncbi:MAG: leucyl aminopeptidase family protein [Pseudomonadota bacterium]|nr:leucyl aminopeptidase family protein [Pseudomonadota bacterium]